MLTQGGTGGRCRLRAAFLCSVVVLALSLSFAAPVQAGAAVADPQPRSLGGAPHAQAQTTAASGANNTTVHENPRRVDREGDTDGLRTHLARSMTRRLGRSVVQLDQSEYDRANRLLGSEYTDAVEKYVDVAGETEGAGGETAREFRRARDSQRRFVNATREYGRTYEEYQAAREAGDTRRARQLARELDAISRNVTQSGDSLDRSLDDLGNRTGANVTETRETVATIRQSVSERTEEVVGRELVRTTLEATPARERAAFDDPVTVTGELRTENGTPVADREISVRIENRTFRSTTDEDGGFEVAYRPTTVDATATNVTVEYLPADGSHYLRSNDTAPLTVEAVNGTLEVTDAPDEASYGRTVSAAGRLTVDGEPVAGVPVTVTLGGVPFETVRTDAAGEMGVSESLPATVPAGRQPLRLRMAADDAAVGADPVSRSVEVVPTATALEVDATAADGEAARVTGRLTTAPGAPVPNRTVVLRTLGSSRTTVETNADGRFRTRLSLSEDDVASNGSAPIVAQYPGSGSNLEPSRARAVVTVQSASNDGAGGVGVDVGVGGGGGVDIGVGAGVDAGADGSSSGSDWTTILVGGGVFLLSLAIAVFALGRSGDTSEDAPAGAESAGGGPPDDGSPAGALLSSARRRLREGRTDDAVRSAYAAVRRWGEDRHGIGAIRTHWEFYRAGREEGSADEAESLERLTRLYERAAYDLRQTDEAEASDAVEAAGRLVGPGDSE